MRESERGKSCRDLCIQFVFAGMTEQNVSRPSRIERCKNDFSQIYLHNSLVFHLNRSVLIVIVYRFFKRPQRLKGMKGVAESTKA